MAATTDVQGLPAQTPEAATTPTTPRIHLGYLDGIRACAALYVILHHIFIHLDLTGSPRLGLLLANPLWFGHYGVDVFIVLSGFCLMLPVARANGDLIGGAKKFYLKRARRILPPYYLTLAVSLALIFLLIGHKTGTHWDASVPVTAKGLLLHLLLLQDIKASPQINHVLWSVSVEWRIYFLFPLLVIAYRRFGALPTTVVTLIASYVFWGVIAISPFRTKVDINATGFSSYYLGLFAMGMLAAHIAFARSAVLDRWRNPSLWARVTLISAIVVCLLSYVPLHKGLPLPLQWMSFFVGCFGASLLIWLSVNTKSWAHRLFSWRPLVFLGAFAFSLYLIHAPLIQILWQYAIHPLHLSAFTEFLLLVFPGVPIIVAGCYLFFLACERPFLTKRRNETTAQTERDAALSPAP